MVKRLLLASVLTVGSLLAQSSAGQQTIYYTVLNGVHTTGNLQQQIPSYLSLGQSNHELIVSLVNFNSGTCTADGVNAQDYFIRLEGSFDQSTWIALGGMVYDHIDSTTPLGSTTTTKFFQGSYPFLRVNVVAGNQTTHCAFTIRYIGSFSNALNNVNVRAYNYNLNVHSVTNWVNGGTTAGVAIAPVMSQVSGTGFPYSTTISIFGLKIWNQGTSAETLTFGLCDKNGAAAPVMNTTQILFPQSASITPSIPLAINGVLELPYNPLAPYWNAVNYTSQLGASTQEGPCLQFGTSTAAHNIHWEVSYELN